MTADDFRAELENELKWRQEEIAFFKNQLNAITEERDRDKYRKILVLLLYSHMEGYIKIALQTYIKYINFQQLRRSDVIVELMVAGMHREFLAYDNLDKKNKVFSKKLPNDSNIHRFSRRVDFMVQIDDFKEKILEIEDNVIDTESNLWYIVLKKNLYQIGLPIKLFEEYENVINAVVNRRNSIAHGNSYAGVKDMDFSAWETKINQMLFEITKLLYSYVYHKKYLKNRALIHTSSGHSVV